MTKTNQTPTKQTTTAQAPKPSPLFEVARSICNSPMLPIAYRDVGSCYLLLELQQSYAMPLLQLAQSLITTDGGARFGAPTIYAILANSPKFVALEFVFSGEVNTDGRGCHLRALCAETGDTLIGDTITIAQAKLAGWATESNHYATIPETMLRWRATTFFAKLHAGDLFFGVASADEFNESGVSQKRRSETFAPFSGQSPGTAMTLMQQSTEQPHAKSLSAVSNRIIGAASAASVEKTEEGEIAADNRAPQNTATKLNVEKIVTSIEPDIFLPQAVSTTTGAVDIASDSTNENLIDCVGNQILTLKGRHAGEIFSKARPEVQAEIVGPLNESLKALFAHKVNTSPSEFQQLKEHFAIFISTVPKQFQDQFSTTYAKGVELMSAAAGTRKMAA